MAAENTLMGTVVLLVGVGLVFATTCVATTVRHYIPVQLWISHFAAETVIGVRNATQMGLTCGTPPGLRPVLLTGLRLCPGFDALQVKDVIAVLAIPDPISDPNRVAAHHTLELSFS